MDGGMGDEKTARHLILSTSASMDLDPQQKSKRRLAAKRRKKRKKRRRFRIRWDGIRDWTAFCFATFAPFRGRQFRRSSDSRRDVHEL
jgi:hypothetical protein